MSEPSEVTVKIKDEDVTLTEKFLNYKPVSLSTEDPILREMVDQTKAKYSQDLKDPDIEIKIKFIWQE